MFMHLIMMMRFFLLDFWHPSQTMTLTIGGDFNTCLDPMLDRSSKRQITVSRSAKTVNSFLKDYAVADVWRSLNPTTRAFFLMFTKLSPVLIIFFWTRSFSHQSGLVHMKQLSFQITHHSPLNLNLTIYL